MKVKNLKAGILLYALFLLLVFSLLLTFYLNRQVARTRLYHSLKNKEEALAMAVYIREKARNKSGQIPFKGGRGDYEQGEKSMNVHIYLSNGQDYRFSFPQSTSPSSSQRKESEGTSSTSSSQKKGSD